MINIVKYGAIATLAIIGTLATGGTAASAVLAGGIAIASSGVEQICDTASKENNQSTNSIASVLKQNSCGKSLKEQRDRVKKGLPTTFPRDKRIAGR